MKWIPKNLLLAISCGSRRKLWMRIDARFYEKERMVRLGRPLGGLFPPALGERRRRVGFHSANLPASEGLGHGVFYESACRLTVDDDGVGMPSGENKLKPGLGTGIVEALSRQLEATVKVTDHAPGTKVSIVHLA